MVKKNVYLYDAFPNRKEALSLKNDLNANPVRRKDRTFIKKGNYGDNGRLKFGVYTEEHISKPKRKKSFLYR